MCLEGGFKLTKFVRTQEEWSSWYLNLKEAKNFRAALKFFRTTKLLVSSGIFPKIFSVYERKPWRYQRPSVVYCQLFIKCTIHWFLSPFLLESKWILQYLCSQNVGWDEKLPEELQRTCFSKPSPNWQWYKTSSRLSHKGNLTSFCWRIGHWSRLLFGRLKLEWTRSNQQCQFHDWSWWRQHWQQRLAAS